jgi:hypothetical protein
MPEIPDSFSLQQYNQVEISYKDKTEEILVEVVSVEVVGLFVFIHRKGNKISVIPGQDIKRVEIVPHP